MTQAAPEHDQAPAQSKQPTFGIQRVFLKGMSLEVPLGSKVFLQKGQPQVSLAMQVNNQPLEEGIYEVCLRATVTSTLDGKTLFLLEAEQAGIVVAQNMVPAQLADVLEIGGPSILAPYLRAQLSDALARATLPAFILPEFNWAAMAMERRAQAAGQLEAPKQVH